MSDETTPSTDQKIPESPEEQLAQSHLKLHMTDEIAELARHADSHGFNLLAAMLKAIAGLFAVDRLHIIQQFMLSVVFLEKNRLVVDVSDTLKSDPGKQG